MEYPNRLYSLRVNAKKSQTEMAKLLGISQPEYSRMEKGRRRIDTYLNELKQIFDVDESCIVGEFTAAVPLGPAQTENKLCPIYGMVTKHHQLVWTEKPVKWIDMPAVLKNVEDAYCCYVPGNDMEPKFSKGDLLLVDPTTPANVGDIVVFACPDTQERRIAKLSGMTGKDYEFTFIRTGESHKVANDMIDSIHVVRGVRF